MTGSPVISIDAMGGDRGPAQAVAGLARVLKKAPGARFLVHGDAEVLRPLLARRRALAEASEIRHAPDTVRMDERPSRALREKRQSSMWHALEAVRSGEASVAVSAGNTGALLAMSVLILRKAPGVDRPAIAVHWPADRPEGYNTVLDVGADLRADPHQLAQYAVMGAEYARVSLGIAHPRVGLLNLGTEPTKGPEELREAAALIGALAGRPEAAFDYVGFVEGAHIPTNAVDVIVTDGFTGNIALKTAEGTAAMIRTALKQAFRSTPLSRLAGLFAYTSLQRLKKRIDPRRVNGGVFLGLDGAVVKSHGGADAIGFAAAVRLGLAMAERDFARHVAQQLVRLEPERGAAAPEIAEERSECR
jgi:glycerol-3-phosphate acyltransferase PlsX